MLMEAEEALWESEWRSAENELYRAECERRANERVRVLERQLEESKARLQASSVDKRAEELDKRAEVSKRIAEELDRRAEVSDRRVEELGKIAEELDRRAEESDRRVEELDKRAEALEIRGEESGHWKSELSDSRRAEELERMVEESTRRAEELERRVQESDRRAEESDRRAEELERRAQESDRRAQESDRKAQESYRTAARRAEESDRRAEELERRAQESDRRAQESDRRARESDRMVEESDRMAEESVRRAEESVRRAEELGMHHTESRRSEREQTEEAERRLVEMGERLRVCEEEELHGHNRQWVVRREEMELTGPELGRGGWATVSVATFRGIRVAAKTIHGQIICHHNLQLFKREMNMAARLRHPNLVQFIGATIQGEMMILTELMPTSLRRELEREYMPPGQATSISLDVAKALNYLHLMQPVPIIHRDISSANVLLEPLPFFRWRAKVTDYGSVNVVRQLNTKNPGSPAYAAPEAHNPQLHSDKMDIFSFGALVLEMLTGQLPAPENRERLLNSVHHEQLLDLIRRCLSVRREDRPDASDIITELNH